jgi:adenosylcobinamide-GDP ribazoletransferase
MRSFLLALQFLTIITIRSDFMADGREMADSRYFYGLVGIILGLLLALAAWLLGLVLPPLVLAGLVLFLWEAGCRFLHLDALADTADALVHPTSRERALEIMKDSRLGSFAAGAMILVLLIKFACLATLPRPLLLAGLVAVPAMGRAAAALLSCLMPPARLNQGLGAAISGGSPWPGLVSAACALAAACLAGLPGLWAAMAALATGVALGLWYHRRLGGVTGDTLGAAVELCETSALLVLSVWA